MKKNGKMAMTLRIIAGIIGFPIFISIFSVMLAMALAFGIAIAIPCLALWAAFVFPAVFVYACIVFAAENKTAEFALVKTSLKHMSDPTRVFRDVIIPPIHDLWISMKELVSEVYSIIKRRKKTK